MTRREQWASFGCNDCRLPPPPLGVNFKMVTQGTSDWMWVTWASGGTCEGDFGDVSMIHPRKTNVVSKRAYLWCFGDFGWFWVSMSCMGHVSEYTYRWRGKRVPCKTYSHIKNHRMVHAKVISAMCQWYICEKLMWFPKERIYGDLVILGDFGWFWASGVSHLWVYLSYETQMWVMQDILTYQNHRMVHAKVISAMCQWYICEKLKQ